MRSGLKKSIEIFSEILDLRHHLGSDCGIFFSCDKTKNVGDTSKCFKDRQSVHQDLSGALSTTPVHFAESWSSRSSSLSYFWSSPHSPRHPPELRYLSAPWVAPKLEMPKKGTSDTEWNVYWDFLYEFLCMFAYLQLPSTILKGAKKSMYLFNELKALHKLATTTFLWKHIHLIFNENLRPCIP